MAISRHHTLKIDIFFFVLPPYSEIKNVKIKRRGNLKGVMDKDSESIQQMSLTATDAGAIWLYF